ncbi:hypothetical protein BPOR_0300g00100 [Botrytis porri]|uniref:Sulfotransferase domain-containing protein n=1 Tax=Botrytis porri TaxID=87229 RepID=A0A4Z1KK88_9HELO|nr:hypothetical protein BPOR_0300g00100 [Botrytis porri]
MPAVNFSEEHLLAYPDAKVVLTTRDPDKWIASVESSMYAIIHSRLLLPVQSSPIPSTLLAGLADWSNGNPEDRVALRAGFLAHNENIRKLASGRLLEFSLPKNGWEPLCFFGETCSGDIIVLCECGR